MKPEAPSITDYHSVRVAPPCGPARVQGNQLVAGCLEGSKALIAPSNQNRSRVIAAVHRSLLSRDLRFRGEASHARQVVGRPPFLCRGSRVEQPVEEFAAGDLLLQRIALLHLLQISVAGFDYLVPCREDLLRGLEIQHRENQRMKQIVSDRR